MNIMLDVIDFTVLIYHIWANVCFLWTEMFIRLNLNPKMHIIYHHLDFKEGSFVLVLVLK